MEARLAESPAERRPDHPFRGACGAAAPGLGCAAPGLRWAARPGAGCQCRAPPPPPLAPSPPPAIVPTCSAPPRRRCCRCPSPRSQPSPARPPVAAPAASLPALPEPGRGTGRGGYGAPRRRGSPSAGRGCSAQQRAPSGGGDPAAAGGAGRAQVRARAPRRAG